MKKSSILTRQQKIDALTKDFLRRDGDTFVFRTEEKRLGWESRAAGGRYSAVLYGKGRIENRIAAAKQTARGLLAGMCIPGGTDIRLSKDGSRTDGRTVYVDTTVFDEESIDRERQLDTFMGFAIHEGCHLLYTDFADVRRHATSPLAAKLANIIEDERIERLLGLHKPGLANFLAAAKNYAFGRYDRAAREKAFSADDEVAGAFNAMLAMVRYPAMLTEDAIDRYGELLIEIRDILTPYPQSTAEAGGAAARCLEKFREYLDMRQRDKKTKEKQENGEGDPQEDPANGDPDDEEQPGAGAEGEGGVPSPEENESPESGNGGGSDAGEAASGDDLTEEETEECAAAAERSLKALEKDLSDILRVIGGVPSCCSGKGYDNDDAGKSEALRDDATLMVAEGDLEEGAAPKTYFKKKTTGSAEDRKRYAEARRSILPHVAAMRKALSSGRAERDETAYGMRSGTLDTGKLAEAVQGAATVYTRKMRTVTQGAAVAVLIDQSGSMKSWTPSGQRRIDHARETAILIDEALRDVPKVELFIYGHTADVLHSGDTHILVYREKGHAPKDALGAVSADDNNRDGVAIEEAARRIRSQTASHVMMFVISDGQPAANPCYSGETGMALTRESVRRVEKQGFTVMQISVHESCESEKMFNRWIYVGDAGELPARLARQVRRDLGRATRKTTTLE